VQVWVPSHFGLEQFVSSGVKREKIAVVPEAALTLCGETPIVGLEHDFDFP